MPDGLGLLSVTTLLLAILMGYLLGSVPVAVLISRRRRLDIFTIGTGLPGATNVFRNVGRRAGVLVVAGDAAKGAIAIFVATRLGLEGAILLLPAAAAVGGHWRSIFTRFRGGDGVATLLGATTVVVPVYGAVAVALGIVVGLLSHRSAHPSLWGGTMCYSFLLIRSLTYRADTVLTLGLVVMALMVLSHAVRGHRRRRVVPTSLGEAPLELGERGEEGAVGG